MIEFLRSILRSDDEKDPRWCYTHKKIEKPKPTPEPKK